jgi:hypothetical protein
LSQTGATLDVLDVTKGAVARPGAKLGAGIEQGGNA